MMKRALLAVAITIGVVSSSVTLTWAAGGGPRVAATYYPPCTQQTLGCHQSRLNADDVVLNGLRSSVASLAARPTPTATATVSTTATVTATATATVTATPTPTVTPTPTPTPTVTPTPTSTAFACTAQLGGSCGPYLSKATWPGSNGYNTYVSNQALGGSGTEVLSANGPADWKVVANLPAQGGSVLTFPNVQQLTNNWSADGSWSGQDVNTPIDSLSSLKITYNETSPGGSNAYEFAPDIFQDGYANDVMLWVDTNGRCNAGAFGSTLLGHFTMDGQGWTAHRYGGPGAEIILVLDGPGGQGTCAQQSSGTIDVKAAFAWLSAGGFIPAHPVLYIVQTGWEMTGESNATFRLNSYTITATL